MNGIWSFVSTTPPHRRLSSSLQDLHKPGRVLDLALLLLPHLKIPGIEWILC